MKIQWLISTYGKGILDVENILLLPENGLSYLVSHQTPESDQEKLPEKLLRPDVQVSQLIGTGLSANRNNALRHATGDVLILADDDIRLKPAYPHHIRKIFEKHPEVDVACFQIRTGQDEPDYKQYPTHEKNLNSYGLLKNVSSIEIAFRRKAIQKHHIRFDERFGLGAPANCGEEFLFLAECLRKGLKIRFFPIYIVEHPFNSSAKERPFFDDQRIFVTGAQNYVLYGDLAFVWNAFAVLRRMFKLKKEGFSARHFLRTKNAGSRYIKYGTIDVPFF
jgi:glycosyltransferase involved in cell wall biosynthesis